MHIFDSLSGLTEDDPVSGIRYINGETFCTCSRNTGEIRLFDLRQPCDRASVIHAPDSTQMPCVFSATHTGWSLALNWRAPIFIERIALAKQGDNPLGRVCLFACALLFEPFDLLP